MTGQDGPKLQSVHLVLIFKKKKNSCSYHHTHSLSIFAALSLALFSRSKPGQAGQHGPTTPLFLVATTDPSILSFYPTTATVQKETRESKGDSNGGSSGGASSKDSAAKEKEKETVTVHTSVFAVGPSLHPPSQSVTSIDVDSTTGWVVCGERYLFGLVHS